MRTDEGALEPVWSCGPVLPTSLVDLLDTDDSTGSEEDEELDYEDEDVNFDELIDSDDE